MSKRLGGEAQFKKDVRRARKRKKDISKLIAILDTIAAGTPLDKSHKPHLLKGKWSSCWECHIEPDWLLIWAYDSEGPVFLRTGTHSELFQK